MPFFQGFKKIKIIGYYSLRSHTIICSCTTLYGRNVPYSYMYYNANGRQLRSNEITSNLWIFTIIIILTIRQYTYIFTKFVSMCTTTLLLIGHTYSLTYSSASHGSFFMSVLPHTMFDTNVPTFLNTSHFHLL